jgi:hypothetical protein
MNNGKSSSTAPSSISRLLPNAQQKRDAAETRDRNKRERRYAAMAEALQKHPKMTRPEDRKIVATNLWEILDRFERERKGKKEAVLRASNMGREYDSTKQLYNYVLPRSPTRSKAYENRLSKLVKKCEGYVKIAQIAADMATWDKRHILIDLFRGSTYDSEVSGAVPDLPDYLFSLYEILERLNGWLVRESRINWYYDTLRRYPVWDDWGNFIVNSPMWPPGDSVQSPAYYGKAIPGVILYRFLCAELPADFVSKESYPEMDGDEPEHWAQIERLTFRHYFDLRLGLAPVGTSGNIRLVFDQRRVGELWEVQQPANPDEGTDAIEKWRAYVPWYFRPASLIKPEHVAAWRPSWSPCDFYGAFDPPIAIVEEGLDSENELGLFGGWIRFTTPEGNSALPNELFETVADFAINKDDALSRAMQDQYVEEVELSTCKKYLDKKNDERFGCRWGSYPKMPVECPAGTIAASIESALYSNSLDLALQNAIEHQCSILERCIERRKNVIAENKEKLFSRWGINETSSDSA